MNLVRRILLPVYVLLFVLVCSSLSVAPGDLPLFAGMIVVAAAGLILTLRDSGSSAALADGEESNALPLRRLFWISALILAILGGGFEIFAGNRMARQRANSPASLTNSGPVSVKLTNAPGP